MRTIQPTPEDLKVWRRLIETAQRAAAAPRRATPELAAAVERSRKAVVFDPPATKASLAVRLFNRSRQFLAQTARGREEMAAELGALAAECAARLEGAAAAPPARRFRADLDG
jgi:hypothetical protein